jgi:colicin import membrane protein
MNRLQKKCAIATAGIHLLLLLVLLFGSAFFSPRPKPDDTQLLDVIPANLIDAAFNSGVRQAAPPAPAPVVVPPPQPTPPTPVVQPAPQPPAPKPVVTPPPTLTERLKEMFTPEPVPEPAKPAPKKAETKPHQIQINTQLVARTAPKNSASKPQSDVKAINSALKNLRNNLSAPTEVNLRGDSTVAYANYGNVVTSVYHQKWITLDPSGMEKDNAVIIFKVTIASDGAVISARIITPSGDANVDTAVQRMLDNVTVIAPFPEGATEKERSYTINFNATRTSE